jgi:hypothetical protein
VRTGFALLLLVGSLAAQQPFYTDDADVTVRGKFHLEWTNQYSWLQHESLPNLRQNASRVQVNYGLLNRVEIGADTALLALFNAPGAAERRPAGMGDTNFTVKWNFRRERLDSRLPASTLSLTVEAPTGDAPRQLGSGVVDFGANFILQKSIRKRTVVRLNNGLLFAGNTLEGAIGLKAHGLVYTGGGSVTRRMTSQLLLGIELTGAAARDADLGRGAMQAQFGGKYAVARKLSFDFGALAGRFAGSPRIGVQAGFSYDF